MSMITVDGPTIDASVDLQAYVARPDGDGPWPGVVMVHEIFGLTDMTRRHAEHLAELGYLVLAPDLFTGGSHRQCLRRTMGELQTGTGLAFDNIAAARQWLLDSPECTGKVGIIGFCMGGRFALLTAATGFDVSAPCYGMVPEEHLLDGACPIVASYGRSDITLRGAAQQLATALTARGIDYDIKEYPGAGHAFMNDALEGPWYLKPVFTVLNMTPNPAASADAWMRIDAFFSRHLRTD